MGLKADLRAYVADLRRGMRQSWREKNIIIKKNIFILIRELFKPSDDERRFQYIISKKTAQLERPDLQFFLVKLGFEQLLTEVGLFGSARVPIKVGAPLTWSVSLINDGTPAKRPVSGSLC